MKSRYVSLVLFATFAAPLVAQEVAIPTSTAPAVSSSSERTFERAIAIDLEHVSLKDALRAIGQQAGVTILYSGSKLPSGKLVSLVASKITVRDALTAVLDSTGLEAAALVPGIITVQPVASHSVSLREMQQGAATLSGLVTDSGTGAIITQAVVHVDGTQLTTHTNATGHYSLNALAAGEYRITVRKVGYLSKTRIVTLSDSGDKTLDFQLNQPATTLNEVVTTATGQERRYQVGSDIATINVDSIAPDAPVTSVTDLLAARVPGLEVVQSSGLAGAGPAIRIWGQHSLLLQSDPIVIVDGIRVDNTPGGNNPLAIGNAAPARLNDIDLSSIETINVLKGPSATTEYGTDAANGVIIITTKRGHAGAPMWTASANQSATIIPTKFSNYYWDWGHLTDGSAAPTWSAGDEFPFGPCNFSDPLSGSQSTAGSCVVDSITAFNPFNHTATTEYGTGPASRYSLNVNGGSEQFRYFLSGNVQNQQGNIHTPDIFRSEAEALGYSNSAFNPNSVNQRQLHANSDIAISRAVTANISVGYQSTYQETPGTGFSAPSEPGPALDDSVGLYGYGIPSKGPQGGNPLISLGQTSSQQTEHWNSGAVIDWTPVSWIQAHLITGIDHEAQTDGFQVLPQSAILLNDFQDSSAGSLYMEQVRNDVYTVNLQGVATTQLFRQLQLVTTFGASYVQTTYQGLIGSKGGLSASGFNFNSGSTGTNLSQAATSSAAEGVYVEEQLHIGSRCTLPLDLRLDAGSAFGTSAGATTYPGWSVSCVVLTGATTLVLRGAYGGAGVQPPQGSDALQFVTEPAQLGNSQATTAYQYLSPGNPNVKPEYDRDWEGGADLQIWHNRLAVSGTVYDTDQHNLLYNIPLGISFFGNYTENVGDVRNRGAELTVTMTPLQQRSLAASIQFTGSYNHNKLLRLAPDLLSTYVGGGTGELFTVGYPLYSYFGDSILYRDLNHDGILEANEISFQNYTYPQPDRYMGSSSPVTLASAQPSISLFPRGLVRVNAVFQYAGGYKVYNNDGSGFEDQSASVLGSPLWLQAYDYTHFISFSINRLHPDDNDFLDGSYLAWNELAVAFNIPARVLRMVRVRTASVVFGVNNVALWTPYPFGDPRVSNGAGPITNSVTNVNSANNDIRSTGATVVPLTRAYMFTINLGL